MYHYYYFCNNSKNFNSLGLHIVLHWLDSWTMDHSILANSWDLLSSTLSGCKKKLTTLKKALFVAGIVDSVSVFCQMLKVYTKRSTTCRIPGEHCNLMIMRKRRIIDNMLFAGFASVDRAGLSSSSCIYVMKLFQPVRDVLKCIRFHLFILVSKEHLLCTWTPAEI